jgi:uncharacterized phage-associated protein
MVDAHTHDPHVSVMLRPNRLMRLTTRTGLARIIRFVYHALAHIKEPLYAGRNEYGRRTTRPEAACGRSWLRRDGGRDRHRGDSGRNNVAIGKNQERSGSSGGPSSHARARWRFQDSSEGSRSEVGVMAYDPRALANYILDKAEKSGVALTQMQLQKLVYFAHGWHLANTGQPLSKAWFSAWKWGPVNTQIYNKFKKYGGKPITGLAKDQNGEAFPVEFSDYSRKILDEVFDNLGQLNGPQLSKETHLPGSPWYKVWNNGKGENAPIPDDMIKDYFEQKYKAA